MTDHIPVRADADRLRILQVVEASFAGVGRHVLDLSEGLLARGHAVDLVYSPRRAEPWFKDRVSLLPFGAVTEVPVNRIPGANDLAAASRVRAALATQAFDIVHGHASRGGAWARLCAANGAARVYTPNALITQSPTTGRAAAKLYAAAEKWMAKRTDGIVHVSKEEADHALAIGLAPRRLCMIPNGVALVDLPSRAQARFELGLPNDATVVGFVGRLVPQKGVELLIDAAERICEQTDAVIAIVGDGADREDLHARAMQSGAKDSILWLGQHRGQEAMPAFDVLAVPSRYEGFPYVVLEALWAGVPVVATKEACANAAISDRRAGVVVDRNSEQFADGVVALLNEKERVDRSDLPIHVSKTFSVDSMVEATVDFYRCVLSEMG